MSRVWDFLTKPIFTIRAPAWTIPAVIAFVISGYVSYRATIAIRVRYLDSRQFSNLPVDQARDLRTRVKLLSTIEAFGILTPNDDKHLRLQIQRIESIRPSIPADVRDILNLQQATNYLILARMEQEEKAGTAIDDIAAARVILRSLGWGDVPDEELLAFAAQQTRWRAPSQPK